MNYPSLLKVFVYGTLKPGEANYQAYCSDIRGDKVSSHTPGYTWGNLYDLPQGYPAMTEGKNKVQGVLLTFADSSILDDLDRLEGYQAQRASKFNLYTRQLVRVYSLEDILLADAQAYFMTVERVNHYDGTLIESGIWQSRQ